MIEEIQTPSEATPKEFDPSKDNPFVGQNFQTSAADSARRLIPQNTISEPTDTEVDSKRKHQSSLKRTVAISLVAGTALGIGGSVVVDAYKQAALFKPIENSEFTLGNGDNVIDSATTEVKAYFNTHNLDLGKIPSQKIVDESNRAASAMRTRNNENENQPGETYELIIGTNELGSYDVLIDLPAPNVRMPNEQLPLPPALITIDGTIPAPITH